MDDVALEASLSVPRHSRLLVEQLIIFVKYDRVYRRSRLANSMAKMSMSVEAIVAGSLW